jgi:hypothetical protein
VSVRVLGRVWDHSQHGGTTLLVLLKLADHADDHGFCRPSIEALARGARIDRRTVQRRLRALEETGELTVVEPGTGRRATRYRVIVGDPDEGRQIAAPTTTDEGRHDATPGAAPVPPQGRRPCRPNRHRTVSGTETPPAPRGGERPSEPDGKRRRDQERYLVELAAWAPHPAAVDGDIGRCWRGTVERLEQLVPRSDATAWVHLDGLHPHRLDDATLVLGAPAGREWWVRERFSAVLADAASDGFGRALAVDVVPCGEAAA